MSELNIGGSNMTVELRDETTLYAKANTGNQQWVAVLTDTHPKYNYEREFVAYQQPKTSDRDSGTETVEGGAVLERVRYTHSGKNRSDTFYQLVGGEVYEIDEADVEAAIGGGIIPDIEEETHECEECGDEFDTEHGVAVHAGLVHSDDEESNDEPAADAEDAPVAIADGGEEVESIEHEYEDGVSEVYTATTSSGETYRVSVEISSGTGDGHQITAYAADSVPQWVIDAVERNIEADYDSEPATDGGLEVRDYRGDLEFSTDDLVRNYTTPPGERIYAYRSDDGEHHIVVSRGKEPGDQWEARVQAERTHVVPGEQLWTIPDNWEKRVHSKRNDIAYGLFEIPETGRWVKLSIPTNDWLGDAWYGVKAIGELSVAPVGELGTEREVRDLAAEYREKGHEDDAAAFEAVADNWDAVAADLEQAVEWVRDDGIDHQTAGDQPLGAADDWTIEFHRERVFRPGEVLSGETNLSEYEIPDGVVLDELRNAGLLPSYYKFELGLDDSEIGMEEYIRGLIEAGVSTVEALDYYMAEVKGLTQTAWADERGVDQSTVSGNVSAARRELKA